MYVFNTINETQEFVSQARRAGKTIGFVPTMGALHKGHLALMQRAKNENDLLIVSIFVNPIQFNNPEDLKKYPRVLEHDLSLLSTVDCDLVFAPTAEEMYPEPVTQTYDFGPLEQVMEGAFRPGHFNGVAVVVKKLLEITQPHQAYFGEKDFQQLAIIKALVKMEKIPVTVVACEIVREKDGLAMSSRNVRLTESERLLAPNIHLLLQKVSTQAPQLSPDKLQSFGEKLFKSVTGFNMEYFQLADDQSLQPIENWPSNQGVRAFVALSLGKVRLIDNIRII